MARGAKGHGTEGQFPALFRDFAHAAQHMYEPSGQLRECHERFPPSNRAPEVHPLVLLDPAGSTIAVMVRPSRRGRATTVEISLSAETISAILSSHMSMCACSRPRIRITNFTRCPPLRNFRACPSLVSRSCVSVFGRRVIVLTSVRVGRARCFFDSSYLYLP